jgi:hypothetical protein
VYTPRTSCGTGQLRNGGLTAVDIPAAQVLTTAHCLHGSQGPRRIATWVASILARRVPPSQPLFHADTISGVRSPANFLRGGREKSQRLGPTVYANRDLHSGGGQKMPRGNGTPRCGATGIGTHWELIG